MNPVLQGIWELRRHWRRYSLAFNGQERRRWISGVLQTALCVTQGSHLWRTEHTYSSFCSRTTLAKNCHDIIGALPVGNRYILVISDYFTKQKEAFPLAHMEACSIAQVVVNEFICQFGIPCRYYSHRPGQELWVWTYQRHLPTTRCEEPLLNPQSDGLVERFNRTLINQRFYDLQLFLPLISQLFQQLKCLGHLKKFPCTGPACSTVKQANKATSEAWGSNLDFQMTRWYLVMCGNTLFTRLCNMWCQTSRHVHVILRCCAVYKCYVRA